MQKDFRPQVVSDKAPGVGVHLRQEQIGCVGERRDADHNGLGRPRNPFRLSQIDDDTHYLRSLSFPSSECGFFWFRFNLGQIAKKTHLQKRPKFPRFLFCK